MSTIVILTKKSLKIFWMTKKNQRLLIMTKDGLYDYFISTLWQAFAYHLSTFGVTLSKMVNCFFI